MLTPVLLGLALLTAQAPAPPPPPHPVALNGAWKLRTGDSASWADPRLDDRGWRDVQVPGTWEKTLGRYDGVGWYRRTIRIPPALHEGPLGLKFATVGDAFEVYWDGRRIGGSGSFPPDFQEAVDPTLVIVPASLLAGDPGRPHVLAVRVYNDYAYGGLMGPVRLGRYDVLAGQRSPAEIIVGGLASFFLAIGVYHLAFFARRRTARENLWFAILCVLMSLYGATWSAVFSAAVNPYVNEYRVGALALSAAAPFFLALVYSLFDLRFGKAEWAAVGWFALAFVAAAVLPLGTLAEFTRWVDTGNVLGLVAVVGRTAAVALRSRNTPHTRLLMAGTATFAGTLSYDVLSEYGWLPIAHVLPGVSCVFWIGFLVFVITVGIATAGKWALTEVTALTDPLTGLARRHVLEDALRREAARLRRTGGSIALVMIDLDHFKQVNDTWGHRVGDQVLARVGRLLRHSARNIDLAARLGGEEMGVLLFDTGLEGASAFTERFCAHLREMEVLAPGGGMVRVTASCGIAVAADLVSPEELMDAADRALYQAKAAGRDRRVEVLLSVPARVEGAPQLSRRRA
ncbi:MAG: diguanylate cyclase [Gemmatimonadetes bacterium]|nr:diguanylate cyclase [Gemmatimonadota bacterium]